MKELLRVDREHVSFNQGGSLFTLYWRWKASERHPTLFRLWAGLPFCRGYNIIAGFGRFHIGKVS